MQSLHYQSDSVRFAVKWRTRQTPVMTLRGLQRLLLIFIRKVAGLPPYYLYHSDTNKKINYSIRRQIPHHDKMSVLLLKLAGDATVRGTTTYIHITEYV